MRLKELDSSRSTEPTVLSEEGVVTEVAGPARETAPAGRAIIPDRRGRTTQLLITGIQGADIPLVQTLTFIFAVLIVLFNLIADILYGILDPRIRYD